MYSTTRFQEQSARAGKQSTMKFSNRNYILQNSNYLQDSLQYLRFNSNFIVNNQKSCRIAEKPYEDDVICLGVTSYQQHFSNTTITLDESQILNEEDANCVDIKNINESAHKIDIPINIENSFTNIEDYEVLSEVGNDTIEIDISQEEITASDLNDDAMELEKTDNNDGIYSRHSSPLDAAIDQLLALGRAGLLNVSGSMPFSLGKNSKRKSQICKFFLKGQCRYGKSGNDQGICEYRHLDSDIQDRNGVRKYKRKSKIHSSGYFSPSRKGITKRLQRNSLYQVKDWITSDSTFRR